MFRKSYITVIIDKSSRGLVLIIYGDIDNYWLVVLESWLSG